VLNVHHLHAQYSGYIAINGRYAVTVAAEVGGTRPEQAEA